MQQAKLRKVGTNNEQRVIIIKELLNAGGTWDEISRELNLTPCYLMRILKSSFESNDNEEEYKIFLKKAKENKKRKATETAEKIKKSSTEDSSADEVVVVETAYLLKRGINSLEKEKRQVCMPYFCVSELEKLTRVCEAAENELFAVRYGNLSIELIKLRGHEFLSKKPTVRVKPRTIGIIAVCNYLQKTKGYKVTLLTGSWEVSQLAKDEGIKNIVKI